MPDDQTPETTEEELDEMSDFDRLKMGRESWNKWYQKYKMFELEDDDGNFISCQRSVDFSGETFNNDIDLCGYHFLSMANFSCCTFNGDISLFKVTFQGTVNFEGAEFNSNADFESAKFQDDVSFRNCYFKGGVSFMDANFSKLVDFSETNFENYSTFENTQFFDAFFENATFFKTPEFWNTTFKDEATFCFATFCESIVFCNSVFEKESDFTGVEFLDSANFSNVKFLGSTTFTSAKFDQDASFSGARIENPINLEDVEFKSVPDFRRTILKAHFTLHNVKVNFWDHAKSKYIIFKMTEDKDAADKLRRLKEFAIDAKDHERELSFFSDEIRAKRFHEGGFWKTLTGYFYEWFSFFGRSIFRPFLWLILIWSGAWALYLKASNVGVEHIWEGAKLSTAALVPFLGASKTALENSKKVLFPSEHAGWVDLIMFGEGLLGLLFIFLIGLALRNRFRI